MLLQREFAVPVRHFAKGSEGSDLPALKGDGEFSFTLDLYFLYYMSICRDFVPETAIGMLVFDSIVVCLFVFVQLKPIYAKKKRNNLFDFEYKFCAFLCDFLSSDNIHLIE